MSFDFIVATIPAVGWLGVVLATYAVIVIPVVFWGLGRTGKRGLAWAILPIITAITAAALWLYVNRQVA